jgi:transposase
MDKYEATGVTVVRDRRTLPGSTKRRRRYSLEEKRAILVAAAEPGASVSEVSRRFSIGRSLIHNWRRQEAVSALGATVRFTPVAIGQDRSAAAGSIEIELTGGVRVRVDAAVDEVALGRVLRALGR